MLLHTLVLETRETIYLPGEYITKRIVRVEQDGGLVAMAPRGLVYPGLTTLFDDKSYKEVCMPGDQTLNLKKTKKKLHSCLLMLVLYLILNSDIIPG